MEEHRNVFTDSNSDVVNVLVWRKADIIFAELDEEIVILHHMSGYYKGLNKIASFIWKKLEQKIKVKCLLDCILKHYLVDEEQCACDLYGFLQNLANDGLIDFEIEQ